jgi:uncharacterized protein YoxC
MEWASILWRVCLGFMLLTLGGLFGYLWFAILPSIRKTLKLVEGLVDQEAGPLLQGIDQTVKALNSELPQLLKNINELTASIQQISELEIRPITHNIQEMTNDIQGMTEQVHQNVAKIDELVDRITDFSQETLQRAEYYRGQLFVPVEDIISLWNGIKAGWEAFRQSRKQDESE